MDGRQNPPQPRSDGESTLDRRRFLTIVGGATAGLALGSRLAQAANVARRAADSVPALQPWTLPDEAPANPLDLARALVGAAVLAPSECNAQPWRFEAEGAQLRLFPDSLRALPRLDPDQRDMTMGLGCALENLLVAARAWGLQPAVSYFPSATPRCIAEVTWRAGGPRRDRAMFYAIPQRRTNRRDYDGRGVFAQNRAQLLSQVPDGVHLSWLDDPRALRGISDLTYEAVHEQVLNRRMQAEAYKWMRFGNDARRRGDGVPLDALEISTLSRFMARHYFDPQSWFLRFGADGLAKQARGAVRSAGAVALLSVPGASQMATLMAGQALERIALKATQLGIAIQPISAPIRIQIHRAELRRRFGVPGDEPLLLVRFGHARAPDPTPRRSAWMVTAVRNT